MSPLALLFLVPFVHQAGQENAFLQAKAALEKGVVKSVSQDAAFTYKLTDHTDKNFIFRETYQRLNEEDTSKSVVRIKFDQIEAILTRTDDDRKKPIKDCDPIVKIVMKSEPEFLNLKTQKWGSYVGEDRFDGIEIVCSTHEQSDEIAEALAGLCRAHGNNVSVLKKFDQYESSLTKAQDAANEKDIKAQEEQRKKSMKPSTKEVREMMSSLKDYVEIFCKGMDSNANDYETTISSINDEGFTVRFQMELLTSGGSQTDSVTIPWHLIKHLAYHLSPKDAHPYVQLHLLRNVKLYRKGVSSETQETNLVTITSPADKALEQIAAWIGYTCHKRGLKITVQDLARG